MARAIYFDCPTGISGDMALGALLDLGLDLAALEAGLAGLALPGWALQRRPHHAYGLSGTQLSVEVAPEQPTRHLADIRAILVEAQLPATVRERSLAIFERLA